MAIGRVNTGGSGSGGTLTVTGIAGHTVTATKDGKTYTRTFNSSGVAVFKGLSTGTWTLTMAGDGQTATRTVDVNADYAVTITYFSATINVTYPSGSTCKATHADGTVLNAPDTSGTWSCVVPKSGTWTVLAEDTSAGKSKSVDVSITAEGQVETVTLTYELYIFKSGLGLTAGYSVAGTGGNVSKDRISWSGNSDSGGISMYIKPAVSLNNYTKLCFDFECSYNYGGNYGMGFGVGKDAGASTRIDWTQWTAKVTSTAQGAITRNTVQCDISKLTDSEYIKVVGSYSAGKIYNIWLE